MASPYRMTLWASLLVMAVSAEATLSTQELPEGAFRLRTPFWEFSEGDPSPEEVLETIPALSQCQCLVRCLTEAQCLSFGGDAAGTGCVLYNVRGNSGCRRPSPPAGAHHNSSQLLVANTVRYREGLAALGDWCDSDEECQFLTAGVGSCQQHSCSCPPGQEPLDRITCGVPPATTTATTTTAETAQQQSSDTSPAADTVGSSTDGQANVADDVTTTTQPAATATTQPAATPQPTAATTAQPTTATTAQPTVSTTDTTSTYESSTTTNEPTGTTGSPTGALALASTDAATNAATTEESTPLTTTQEITTSEPTTAATAATTTANSPEPEVEILQEKAGSDKRGENYYMDCTAGPQIDTPMFMVGLADIDDKHPPWKDLDGFSCAKYLHLPDLSVGAAGQLVHFTKIQAGEWTLSFDTTYPTGWEDNTCGENEVVALIMDDRDEFRYLERYACAPLVGPYTVDRADPECERVSIPNSADTRGADWDSYLWPLHCRQPLQQPPVAAAIVSLGCERVGRDFNWKYILCCPIRSAAVG